MATEPSIFVLAARGEIDAIKSAIQNGADINERDWHTTVLGAACSYGRVDVVKFLLDNKVNVNPGTLISPLEAATLNGHKEIVDILKAHGAV